MMQHREMAVYRVIIEGKDGLGFKCRRKDSVRAVNAREAIKVVEQEAVDRLNMVVVDKSQARRISL